MIFKTLDPLPEMADDDLLEYATVRKIFKWSDNIQIRRAVQRGQLVRVRVNGDTRFFRISAASVRAMHTEITELVATAKQFGKTRGDMEAMRRARKQRESSPVPQVTVELDERDIIRAAHNLDKTVMPPFVPLPVAAPVAGPQSDVALYAAYHTAKGAQKAAAYRNLTFRQKNQIIQAERQPEEIFDLVAYRKRVAARES